MPVLAHSEAQRLIYAHPWRTGRLKHRGARGFSLSDDRTIAYADVAEVRPEQRPITRITETP